MRRIFLIIIMSLVVTCKHMERQIIALLPTVAPPSASKHPWGHYLPLSILRRLKPMHIISYAALESRRKLGFLRSNMILLKRSMTNKGRRGGSRM